ncbi:O-antigen polysaccharide polymerase Wzy [Clostridium tertium]|uniref:O-antigen polysaccharide polymerase Wzy n=1 Tax=Clostridium tertium TaxID=1559 RepID=UPI00233124E2|nr:O-antigen polysaccharide polymerase Wzy [Clostridium tertium]MDB1944457.1 O-antigen polysaccharide polymerase Wzy [Clostridium tertium]MDB1951724.1 O-antigen polysaccharide polymerase Wzy [Clostridium tertium]
MIVKFKESDVYSMFLWIINILFIVTFLVWINEYWNNSEILYNYQFKLFPWVCALITVQILSFFIKKVTIYDFALWFVIISYPFMFGYLFRSVFSLDSMLIWNPVINYENRELFHAYIFVILALELFSFGYLLVYKKENRLKKYNLNKILPDKKVYRIGIALFIIGGVSKLINDIQIIYFTQSLNSYSAYSEAVSSGILDDLAYLMLPGVFFIFFSGCIKERSKKLMFIIVLVYLIFFMILTGSRKIQIFSILSIFLAYEFSLEKKRLSISRIVVYTFMAIISLNILIIIRDYRFELESIGPRIVEKLFSFNLFENIIGEIFAETGITLLSVASIIKLVPDIMPYQYGLTYLRTLPSFLPIGWIVGDFFNLASSTYVINTYTRIPVGSSFIGDLYWNWGYVGGGLSAFIFGIIISKLININDKYNIRKGYAMYFSMFSLLIILVRSELFDVYRPIIILIVFVFIFEQFKIIIRKERK